jgi:polyisoprenoid-binding protein YceI
MSIKSIYLTTIAVIFGLLSPHTHADWVLNPQNANFTFVTTKAVTNTETQRFTKLDGSVSKDGFIDVAIDLSSVETGVGIRNERMISMLFEIGHYSKYARFTGQAPDGLIQLAKKNGVAKANIDGLLEMHGVKQAQKISVMIFSEKQNLWVTTSQPILIGASNFGMTGGIEALKNIVALPSINDVISANFVLEFSPKK